MNARRPILATLVTLCALIGALLVAKRSRARRATRNTHHRTSQEVQNTTASLTGIPYPHTPNPEKSGRKWGGYLEIRVQRR